MVTQGEAPDITPHVAALPIAERRAGLRWLEYTMRDAWRTGDKATILELGPHLAALDWLVKNGRPA